MVNEKNVGQKRWPLIASRAFKATIKGVILVAVYLVLFQFIARLSELVPGLQQLIETFVAVYIILIIISTLTAGSILQHFFDTARAFFIIAFLMLSWGAGTFSLTLHGADVVIDVRVFLIIAMMLGLVELAKSVLQTIDHVNEKAELALI
jgi:hypothetical protein